MPSQEALSSASLAGRESSYLSLQWLICFLLIQPVGLEADFCSSYFSVFEIEPNAGELLVNELCLWQPCWARYIMHCFSYWWLVCLEPCFILVTVWRIHHVFWLCVLSQFWVGIVMLPSSPPLCREGDRGSECATVTDSRFHPVMEWGCRLACPRIQTWWLRSPSSHPHKIHDDYNACDLLFKNCPIIVLCLPWFSHLLFILLPGLDII